MNLKALLQFAVPDDGLGSAVLIVDNGTGVVIDSEIVGEPVNPPLGGSGRPLGSVAKVAVLAEALQQGIGPDAVLRLPSCVKPLDMQMCTNRSGDLTVREAVVSSNNVAFAVLAEKVGPQSVVESVVRFDMALNPTAEIGWGRDAVSMESVAALFAALANDGEALNLVDSAGRVLVNAAGRYVSQHTASQARDLLTGVVLEGTGKLAAGDDPRYGKTGTAFGATDAWFAGVSGGVTIVVWVGAANAVVAVKPPQFTLWLSGGGPPARIFQTVADAYGFR